MNLLATALIILAKLDVQFPVTGGVIEQIVLRWTHIVFGIAWIGTLYFFNFAGTPALLEVDGETRVKIYAPLMSRAMLLFRITAVVTWLAGFRYFMILAQTDAAAVGTPSLAAKWLIEWFVCWIVTAVLVVGVLHMSAGPLKNGWLVAAIITVLVIAGCWVDLALLAVPGAGNRTLSISLGGGMGTILLGVVQGAAGVFQKRLIAWTKEQAQSGKAVPPPENIQTIMRASLMTARAAMWITFPMIFFMAASSHYPFLSGI